jgi:ATP-dependent Lon protease
MKTFEEPETLKEKILSSHLPERLEKRLLMEAERLKVISPAFIEHFIVENYINWVLSLPWQVKDSPPCDVGKLEKILKEEYFGQEKVKEQVLEYFSILQLKEESKGTILCFLGPSGTGRTFLGQVIAKALGRKFCSIDVTGINDEAEIKGHPPTFLGALPGKILRALKEVGVNNPVFMIDWIDKMEKEGKKGEPSLALLEALDPEKNKEFLDQFVEIGFDLSNVIFISTATSVEEIPFPLQRILEFVEFTGFVEEEKINIAEKYLIPSQLKKHGLSPIEVVFTKEAIRQIIEQYTSEAGIGSLTSRLEIIFRKCARQKALDKTNLFAISEEVLPSYLGTPIFTLDMVQKKPEVGVAVGLSWTESGGDIMIIEALKMRGSGQVIYTGQLGEVLKESIQAVHSYIRSQAEFIGINYSDFSNYDIHIHFPSGSVPKDGPSAGLTIAMVLASVFSNKPIRNDVAMTGEISLRGKVLPVGGLREKVAAAYRVGIRKIILPKENEKNLQDVPEIIRNKIEFMYVEKVEQALAYALLDFEPGKGLEELLKKEIKKIKKMKTKQVSEKKKKEVSALKGKKRSKKLF